MGILKSQAKLAKISNLIRRVFKSLAMLLSGTGLFLSSWIVIPAPTYFLLPLGVTAPEISPWLLILNAIAMLVIAIRSRRWQSLALLGSLIGLLLCLIPLIQINPTQQQMSAVMDEGLGINYSPQFNENVNKKIKNTSGTLTRSHPFILKDTFTGIDIGNCRYTTGIKFANPEPGLELTMDMYQPPQVGKYPAIIAIYGGAWQNGNPGKNADFNRYMAAQGYTVFAIDYRHAPQYRFPAQLNDVQTAIAFIRKHASEYEADPERIALVGRSSGAHLAMLAAYQPDAPPIRAVVNYYGPVNLTAGYADPPHPDPINVRSVLEAFLGGSPDQLPNQYQIASPISYVKPKLPPTLLVYGSRDHIVQVKFGRQISDRLHSVGSTAIFLEIPWAEHAFDAIFNGLSNQLALYYTERFLAWALR